jgi:predicted MFS family arabinose efflux permease
MRSGLRYVRHQPAIVALTLLAFLATFLGLPLLTFLPVIAREVFHMGVGGYSVMMAWSGAGAVTGALVVAWMGKFPGMGRVLLVVQLAFSVLVFAFAFSPVWWLSSVLLFFAGASLRSCFR